MAGGYDGKKQFGDVWRSADGADWQLVTATAAFEARSNHQVVAHPAPFKYEVTPISVATPTMAVRVLTSLTPVTVMTLTASGGAGSGFWFEEAADAKGVVSVAADGALVATAVVDWLATVSIRVGDAQPVNQVTVAVTMTFVFPPLLASSAAEYVVSPWYTGFVHSLTATRGDGAFTYSWVAGTAALAVDARSGAISLTTAAGTGTRMTAVFAVTDEIGGSVRFTLSVRVLEAGVYGGGELLYLIGGDAGGGEVWRTHDGERWAQVSVYSPSFSPRSEHQALSFDGSLWVIGGDAGGGEVWRSKAGMNWQRVALDSPSFEPRFGHQVAVYDGALWLVGGIGSDGSYFDDVWASNNGVRWQKLAIGGESFAGREGHQVAVHRGSLWVVGGTYEAYESELDEFDEFDEARGAGELDEFDETGGTGETGVYLDDVWRSKDVDAWVSVRIAGGGAFSGRSKHQMFSFGGSLWVVGGFDGRDQLGDVWRSANGRRWVEVDVQGPSFSGRSGHQMAVYGRSLWLTGGNIGGNEVWRSADGRRWERVAIGGEAFSARQEHQLVAHSVAFAYEVTDISVTAPGVLTILADETAPVRLATLAASGGVKDLLFEMVADESGVLSVGLNDGVLVATSLPAFGGFVTATIRVRDAESLNVAPAMMAVTVFREFSVSFSPESAEYVLSPFYVGAVHTLSAVGGDGNYSYSRASGGGAWAVDARTGVVSLTRALGEAGVTRQVLFVVQDGIGGAARFTLSVRFLEAEEEDNQWLYLVGGTGFSLARDVWRSKNGKDWVSIPVSGEGFSSNYIHEVISYRGNLWAIGGVNGSDYHNGIWRSADGMNWVSVAISGERFSGRSGHDVVFYGGSLWLVGGFDGEKQLGDVWRSGNGSDWVSVTVSSPSFSARAGHQVVSYGGSLWVVGGVGGVVGLAAGGNYLRDVWRSGNGSVWVSVSVSSPSFSARSSHQVVFHGGSLWLLGGRYAENRLGDVWRSGNGADWGLVTATAFPGRQGHQAVSYGGSLWVVGGFDGGNYLGDVWRSADGENWVPVSVSSPSFSGRYSHQVVTHTVPSKYRVAPILVTGTEGLVVPTTVTLPLTVATLTATGGNEGGFWFEDIGGSRVLSLSADGVLVATAFVEGVATMTMQVGDSTDVNRATVEVTVLFELVAVSVAFSPSSAEYVLSPFYVGGVHTLSATAGYGGYSYSRVAGGNAWAVDARTGAVSLVREFGAGVERQAVFAVRDDSGGAARFTLKVRFLEGAPYDKGERLFLVGGQGEGNSLFNDVWVSRNGGDWDQVQTSGDVFRRLGGHALVSHRGNLWVIGGAAGVTSLEDVWYSGDGVSWSKLAYSPFISGAPRSPDGAQQSSGHFAWREYLGYRGL